MLSILSAGCAFPSQSVSDKDLDLLPPTQPLKFKPEKRGISIPISYIKETGNLPIKDALPNSTNSPTDLGVLAAEQALKKIDVSVELVELLIGDTSTPWEVCPSEGQRVAGKLGRKIPSYDITASSCALSAQLFTLNQWKSQKIPEYSMIVSASAPSQVINYRNGDERYIFGDGASALVVSTTHQKGWQVKQAHYMVNPTKGEFLKNDLFAPMSIGELPSEESIRKALDSFVSSLLGAIHESVYCIAAPMFEKELLSWVQNSLRVKNITSLSIAMQHGDMLGATSGATFAEKEADLASGSQVLILEVGPGMSVGAVLLEKW